MATSKRKRERDPLHVLLEPESRERIEMMRATLRGVSMTAIINAMIQSIDVKTLVGELIERGDMPDPRQLMKKK